MTESRILVQYVKLFSINNMQVIFQKSDDTDRRVVDVSPTSRIGDSREVAQMLLGLPESLPCKLVVERTNKALEDGWTFQEAGIQHNDKLILSPLDVLRNETKTKKDVINQSLSSLSISSPAQTELIADPVDGLRDWQKAAIAGGIIGAFVLGGMLLLRPSIWSPQVVERTPEEGVERVEESSISPSITQEEAVVLVEKWQSAKKEIFAPPFNRQLGAEVLTDKAYTDNLGGVESSVDWLQNNNAYYTYGVQRVDSVEAFEVEGEQATIDVVITEQRTFYKDNKVINDDNTAFDTRLVRYTLYLDSERWKIADYNTVRVLETR